MQQSKNTLVIGLTGGIGSGKSVASAWFAEQGITVVDTDIVAREIVMPGQVALQKISETFGSSILEANGSLNRAALRSIIFSNPAERTRLEQITHPLIHSLVQLKLTQATSAYVILVSPLLLEGSQRDLVNRVLLIDAPESLQKTRAALRDNQSETQIAQIIDVQMPREQKRLLADDIICNDGTLDQLIEQLKIQHQYYLSLSSLPE